VLGDGGGIQCPPTTSHSLNPKIMKSMKTTTSLCLALAGMGISLLSSCTTADSDGTGATYANPDPLSQQIEMQEKMSQVTRQLQPF
jgi:hypothetical protein